MNAVVQGVLVFLVVATAAGYATIRLMPGVWRRALATLAGRWAAKSGVSEATARRVEAKLSSGGACGSCDSCKACAMPANVDESEPLPSFHRQIAIRRVG